ncbi:MAG: ABC transporter permease, partial [Deltaproteobacteria bacterium]|nr:ABC transporter permease [Deltaproteobacteria bacterium]
MGAEWSYRQYIEGGSLAAAIWTFEGITSAEFPQGLPLEMIVRVFRTYKGDIEKGIAGSVRVRNPSTGLQSDPIYFTAKEFTIDSLLIPRTLVATSADGGTRKVDLFSDIISDGRVEVVLQCLEPAQYYGVAQADFYLRSGNGSFALNYAKSCLGIWFAMLLVAAIGVMFSTFLAGPVALLATLSV